MPYLSRRDSTRVVAETLIFPRDILSGTAYGHDRNDDALTESAHVPSPAVADLNCFFIKKILFNT
ncbi:hypothetical protein MAR_027983 [Mya arenaria]|uniref:Uncharacterized protein n=1 Tax=Mya arenaria TaxID=6604 RepID=A0ABY7DGT8_MYAAR|nr:hypothetical protein MAR_027983 [Mya arenaria]